MLQKSLKENILPKTKEVDPHFHHHLPNSSASFWSIPAFLQWIEIVLRKIGYIFHRSVNKTHEVIEDDDQLLIGFVRCKTCKCEWEALAYQSSINKLECPLCGVQDSEVVGA